MHLLDYRIKIGRGEARKSRTRKKNPTKNPRAHKKKRAVQVADNFLSKNLESHTYFTSFHHISPS